MLRIMKLLWLLLFLFLLPAHAEIYRWVDANGNVVYSDEPHPDAETIDLPASTTYTPVEESEPDILTLSPDDEDNEEDAFDYELRIIAPADDESIWVNNGNVTVSMVVEPGLDAERGDLVLLKIDGAETGPAQASTTFQLETLSRGTHTLSASVIAADGSVISTSEPVTFHLHRTSVLNNSPSSNPAPTPTNNNN